MKQQLQSLLEQAMQATAAAQAVQLESCEPVQVERTRDNSHGDFASNVAMVNAKQFNTNPRQLAAELIKQIPADDAIEKIEVAGPGFINFYLRADAVSRIVPQILQQGAAFGRADFGQGQRVLVEFVSANPTGPLHIGHGRGAAYGDTVAGLLQNAGFEVSREYYVNDAGRQMDILGVSVWLRYLQDCGLDYPYPVQAYQADYITTIARQLHERVGDDYSRPLDAVFTADWDGLDPELQLDRLIAYAGQELGEDAFRAILDAGLDSIIASIRTDLEAFGVSFDTWFSERSLSADKQLQKCIDELQDSDKMYHKDGAYWFASTHYGDEKDRVVQRDNGSYTYFAADIAYHHNKFARGFDKVINIWGADHHGYIKRVKASLQALGADPDRLDIRLVQFATLYRGKEKVSMSTRSGEYVTLKELVDEVGIDAARFFYVMRKSEQHLDFDLELAKSQSNDNPVYYIQYAHARICSVWKQLQEQSRHYDQEAGLANLGLLDSESEQQLMTLLSRYTEQVLNAALACEPHSLCFYLQELAHGFHSYYNTHQFLTDNDALRNSRIALCLATKQVISNGLTILGVSAPEKM
ncbi:MAG: arginine--tRNA ligase [Gammaproteobacteria bacterium]